MADRIGPLENRLLDALPAAEWLRWQPLLEAVDLPSGTVLHEAGDTMSHVYFPTTAIVSLLYVMENGASAEIAVIGREGLVGATLLMGGDSTPSRAVVQSAGRAYRLSSKQVKAEFSASTSVLHLLLRYTQALITQMAQTAFCNRHHAVDQQICRWLLSSLDRIEQNMMLVTPERIASQLGMPREAVDESALRLQGLKLISYARNRIAVLNRSGLERRTCECYAAVKSEYDRLLPRAKAH